MKYFKVFYTNGEYYYTQANGTIDELENHLKQDGGRITFEDSRGEFHRYIDRVEEVGDGRRWYKLEGTYRKQSAIGNFQPIPKQILKADSPQDAITKNRQDLYEAGYDHILYTKVSMREARNSTSDVMTDWEVIPMFEALGLE